MNATAMRRQRDGERPVDRALASYRSIAIHCEKHSKLWAKAAL